MKTIIAGIIFGLLLANSAFALQQVSGKLIMTVQLGGSNYSMFGLMNEGNEAINVSLSSDGNASEFLTFPQTVELPPYELTYVNITASVPSDYDFSMGKNITGYMHAVQSGKPGQVQIDIEMMKSVKIIVAGEPQVQASVSNQSSTIVQASLDSNPTQTQKKPVNPNDNAFAIEGPPSTGYALANSAGIVLSVLIIAIASIALVLLKSRMARRGANEVLDSPQGTNG